MTVLSRLAKLSPWAVRALAADLVTQSQFEAQQQPQPCVPLIMDTSAAVHDLDGASSGVRLHLKSLSVPDSIVSDSLDALTVLACQGYVHPLPFARVTIDGGRRVIVLLRGTAIEGQSHHAVTIDTSSVRRRVGRVRACAWALALVGVGLCARNAFIK